MFVTKRIKMKHLMSEHFEFRTENEGLWTHIKNVRDTHEGSGKSENQNKQLSNNYDSYIRVA